MLNNHFVLVWHQIEVCPSNTLFDNVSSLLSCFFFLITAHSHSHSCIPPFYWVIFPLSPSEVYPMLIFFLSTFLFLLINSQDCKKDLLFFLVSSFLLFDSLLLRSCILQQQSRFNTYVFSSWSVFSIYIFFIATYVCVLSQAWACEIFNFIVTLLSWVLFFFSSSK